MQKRILAMLLALVMVLTYIPGNAIAAETATEVSTLEALQTAISNGATEIKLTAAVTISDDVSLAPESAVTITADGVVDAFTVVSGGKLTLGSNITVTSNNSILWANGGTINVDGAKLNTTNSPNSAAFANNGGAIIIDNNGEINSAGTNVYTVSAKGGATVTINAGKVTTDASSAVQANGATVNINAGAYIETTCVDPAYVAVYAANGGVVNMTGGEAKSAAGYTLCAVANGTINMSGGSVNNGVIAHEGENAKVNISGGTVTGALRADEGKGTIVITGGTFDTDVSAYLAEGLVQDATTGTVWTAIPFEENFDDLAVGEGIPEGWGLWAAEKEEDVGKTVMTVEADADDASNHYLKMAHTAKRSGTYNMVYSFEPTDEALVLEYRFKVAAAGNIYLPVLQYEGTTFGVPLCLQTNPSGSANIFITYGGTRGLAGSAKHYGKTDTIAAADWHTIKQVVDIKNGTIELYIDGQKIDIDLTNTNHVNIKDTKLSRVSYAVYMGCSATNVCIDDLSVKAYVPAEGLTFEKTELEIEAGKIVKLKPVFTPADATDQTITYASSDEAVAVVDADGNVTAVAEGTATITATPAAAGLSPVEITVTVTPSETAIPTIPFVSDFEKGVDEETGLPKGWKLRNAEKDGQAGKTTATIVAEADGSDNNVLKFAQTEKREGWYILQYDFEPTDQAVVFEYKYKVESGTGILYMPSLAYNTTGSTPQWTLVSYTSGGNFYYANALAGWASAGNLAAGEWHTVKQVIDIPNQLCVLYLDGQMIQLDATKYKFRTDGAKLSSITMFFDTGSNGTGIADYRFDDFKLSFGVAGEALTFEETSLTLPVNGAKTLVPKFTPADTSVQTITYASSDETVATVDADGVVTAIAAGTATITATPALPNLAAVEITVKVEGDLQGTIEGAADTMELPVGGHTFLNASVAFDGGIEADGTLKYESSAPAVATVDEYGEVLAVGVGTTTITISSKANPDIKKTVTVTVSEPDVMQTIYVAPNGTGDGSSAATPTTLDGAVALLAAIDKAAMTGNIEVILADGYYYRTEALALTDAHGGNNLYSVIFKAAEGANPTIGGGVTIQGADFTESDIEGVYVYDLSKLGIGTVTTRSMFVDDVRAVRAKGEEAVYGESVLKNAEYLLDANGTKIGFICDNTELLAFDRIQDLEFITKNNWVMLRGQVDSISEVDGRVHIVMKQPGFSKLSSGANYLVMRGDNVLYYENAMELLDEPGEWYLNEATQKLYYMPREWDNMSTATVTLPILDNWDGADTYTAGLVTITGTSSDQQAQNIRFEGITFADTTWSRATERGAHTVQNNYLRDSLTPGYNQKLADGAINVRKANGIQFLDCTFTRLGINAINMFEGVQNSLVQGGHFYDISGAAVGIGQPDYIHDVDNYNPTDPNKVMKNVDVLNNYIHDIAVEYMGAAAISVGFAVDVDISHNEIFHIPYSGLHIGYGWESKRETITKNLNVSENFIHDLMFDLIYDGGAVYTNGNTGGDEEHWNVITRNYFRNQGEKVAPMYSDSGSTWFKWTENVADTSELLKGSAYGTTLSWGYIARNASTDCVMTDNYYSVDVVATGANADTRVFIENNTLVEDLNWPAEALEIIENSGLEADYAHLRNNQIERVVTAITKDGLDLNVGETFDLQVKGTDGKDREVDISNAVFVYKSMDESVATVDQNGVVTAVADGKTTIQIKVLSNSIVDVVELEVYVGDPLVALKLESIDGIISFSESIKELQLKAYGESESGRKVAFDTVTWSVADETIATVDAYGLLKPVRAGSTVLTVTGQRGDVTKTATYNIVVKGTYQGGTVDYMADLFLEENYDKWYQKNDKGYFEIVDGERINGKVSNAKTYTGRMFQNELLTFRMSLKDIGGWPSIVLRTPSTEKTLGYGGTGYIICMGKTGLELHRFNGSVRTQFYGPVVDPAPLYGPAVENPLNDEEFHKIQVGAINEEDGVRLILYIDDVEIFNVLDTAEDAIRDPGYFGLVGYGGDEFVLEYAEVKVDYMEDIFQAENLDKWYQKNDTGYFEIIDGERINGKVSNAKTYTGRMFQNELLTFRMSLNDIGGWPSIVLRTPSTEKTLGYGGTGYIICMGKTGLELHRFNGSVRTQFYGPVVDPAPLYGPAVENPLNDKEFHEIQVGAINEGNNVRLVLYIDGVEIFNVLDTAEDAIRDPGYFGLVGYGGDEFVLEYSEIKVDYMEEIFQAENLDKWYQKNDKGYFEIVDGERINGKVSNAKTYTGKMYQNELLTFRMSLNDIGGWPSLVLRTPSTEKTLGYGGTGYIICMGKTGLELHRFNGSVRTQFYGPVVDPAPLYGPAVTPNPLNDTELHEIQVGAINEGNNVRLLMYIDGVEIFNVLDTAEDAIRDPGYFGLVGYGGDEFVLEYMGSATEEEIEIRHNVTVESDIDFSFFIPKSAVAESGLTVTVVQDRADGFTDRNFTLDQSAWESATVDGVEYWRIRFMDVAAKEMTDKLTLTIEDASGTIATDTYSVAEYAKERIENSEDNKLKALMNAMLHYGAAAQIYFGYKTDDLANAGLEASATATLAAATTAASAVKHNLTLEGYINFSFFVPKSAVAGSGLTAAIVHDRLEGYEDKSVTIAQAEWETMTSGGVEYWRIRYTDVAPKEIADVLTLTITDGTGTVITDAYSVLQYAQNRIEKSGDENLKALMQALQTYGAAAQLYFKYTAAG